MERSRGVARRVDGGARAPGERPLAGEKGLRSGRGRSEKRLIGRREAVSLPDWGVRLRAKVDTGARTSALDVDDVEPRPGGRVRFSIVMKRDRSRRVRVEAPVARIGRVRPSSGVSQVRYFVETRIQLGEVVKSVEISLVPRHGMLCRMLLGRSALAGDFVVDPDAVYRLGRLGTKKQGRTK
jgi:hypothetical protein